MTTQEAEAPYGYKLDGTPRKRAGRPPGARNKPKTGPVAQGPLYGRRMVTTEDADAGEQLPPAEESEQASDPQDVDEQDPSSSIGGVAAGLLTRPRGPGKSTSRAGSSGRVTAALRADIHAKLALILEMPATVWAMRDPYCGEVAVRVAPDVAGTMTKLIIKSPTAVTWFSESADWLLVLELATEMRELLVAVWAHHITHSVGAPNDAGTLDPRQYPAVVRSAPA